MMNNGDDDGDADDEEEPALIVHTHEIVTHRNSQSGQTKGQVSTPFYLPVPLLLQGALVQRSLASYLALSYA